MNYLDIIITVILIWGAYKGFRRGLIFEVAMIIGLVLGFYLAFKSSSLFEEFVAKHFGGNAFTPYLTFLLVISAVILIMVLLAKFFEGILKIANLGLFNKITGALFGLLKSAFILSILFAVMRPMDAQLRIIKPQIKEQSLLYLPVSRISHFIYPALKDAQKVFKQKL